MHMKGISVFPSKIFCLTAQKLFVEKPFCASKNFWYLKSLWIREASGREYHAFPSEVFCLTVPKNFLKEPFWVSEIFGYPKILWIRRGVTLFSTDNLLSHSAKKFCGGTFMCFRNSRVSKNFLSKRLGGLSPFFVENSSSHSADNFRRGNRQCFKKSPVPKKFRNKTGEGVMRFAMEKLLYHRTESFCRGTFLCFRKLLVSKNFRDRRGEGEGVSGFSVGKNLWYCTENFRRRHLQGFRNLRVSKKCIDQWGGGGLYHVQPSKIVCPTVPKKSWRNPSVFQKILGVENFYVQEGVSIFSRGNVFVSQCCKFCGGTLTCFRKFCVSKNFLSKRVRGLLLFLSKIFGPTVPGKIVEE